MKPVFQTSVDPVTGDCLSACVASILECPAAQVPNFHLGPYQNAVVDGKSEGPIFWSNVHNWWRDKTGHVPEYINDPSGDLSAYNGEYGVANVRVHDETSWHAIVVQIVDGEAVFLHNPVPPELATERIELETQEEVQSWWLSNCEIRGFVFFR